jgi:hypothetical protein
LNPGSPFLLPFPDAPMPSPADLPAAAASGQFYLQLGGAGDQEAEGLQRNLSGLAWRDDWLWVGGDEGRSLLRLERLEGQAYGRAEWLKLKPFGLAEGKEEGESDLEGLALDGQRLWLVGSHSSRRLKASGNKEAALSLPRESRRNAHLLGCLHLDGSGRPIAGQRLRPARQASRDALSKVLAAEPLIAPFAAIPGKDNGLDIEGIVARGERLLVGLRGPVLRGVALVADLQIGGINAPVDSTAARCGPPLSLESHRLRYLDLDGLAVRDMAALPGSDDVLLLTGPSMSLDGPSYLYRWREALAPLTAQNRAGANEAITLERPEALVCVRDGRPGRRGDGNDKPEGLEIAADGERLLAWVAYDGPTAARRQGEGVATRLDGFPLP